MFFPATDLLSQVAAYFQTLDLDVHEGTFSAAGGRRAVSQDLSGVAWGLRERLLHGCDAVKPNMPN